MWELGSTYKLIIDGKIHVKTCFSVKEVRERHVVLGDGECIEADHVIFASGYQTVQDNIGHIFWRGIGRDARTGLGVLHSEGGLRNVGRPTNVQNFYVLAGGVIYSRPLSRPLALLIKARLVARRFWIFEECIWEYHTWFGGLESILNFCIASTYCPTLPSMVLLVSVASLCGSLRWAEYNLQDCA